MFLNKGCRSGGSVLLGGKTGKAIRPTPPFPCGTALRPSVGERGPAGCAKSFLPGGGHNARASPWPVGSSWVSTRLKETAKFPCVAYCASLNLMKSFPCYLYAHKQRPGFSILQSLLSNGHGLWADNPSLKSASALGSRLRESCLPFINVFQSTDGWPPVQECLGFLFKKQVPRSHPRPHPRPPPSEMP